jgi:hypothetical protein
MLPEITQRARNLVEGRSLSEVFGASAGLSWLLQNYPGPPPELIEELSPSPGMHSCDNPGDGDGGNYGDCGENVVKTQPSETARLKECVELFDVSSYEDFPDGRAWEYFGVLALEKIAETLRWLDFRPTFNLENASPQGRQLVEARQASWQWHPPGSSLAANCALEAMEAVAWGEHLQLLEGTESTSVRLVGLSQAVANEFVKEKISMRARVASDARHRENRAMKEEVQRYFLEHRTEFKSLDHAAQVIQTVEKLVPMALRTVRSWVAEINRQVPPARRP